LCSCVELRRECLRAACASPALARPVLWTHPYVRFSIACAARVADSRNKPASVSAARA
jgi:hypothetical protein